MSSHEHISVHDVEITSREFDDLASAVSKKLTAFMKWLNDLPSHTTTEVFELDPDQDPDGNGDEAFGLKLDRGKTSWQLFYSFARFCGPEMEDVSNVGEWHPLDHASLRVRCTALSLLPKLIKEMHLEQSRLVRRLQSANAALDSLPIAEGGKEGA